MPPRHKFITMPAFPLFLPHFLTLRHDFRAIMAMPVSHLFTISYFHLIASLFRAAFFPPQSSNFYYILCAPFDISCLTSQRHFELGLFIEVIDRPPHITDWPDFATYRLMISHTAPIYQITP